MALEGATQLLDFSQKLDINMLDNVIKTMYHGTGPQVSLQYLACWTMTFVMSKTARRAAFFNV